MKRNRPAAVFIAVLLLLLVIGAGLTTGEPLLQMALVADDPAPDHDAPATEPASPAATSTSFPTETPTSTPSPTPSLTPTSTPTATRTRIPASVTPPPRVAHVPILMYHYVGILPPDADKVRMDLTVLPDAFGEQMDYLAANSYHPIQLSDLADYLLNGTPLPDKPIVLTFDDGYTDNYTYVFPTLRSHKFPATFFIITDLVNENRWGYMSWSQLTEMVKDGMEIGSHSLDHPSLARKSRTYQNNEIAGSKKMIEANLPTTVVSFSYPSGDYDTNTLAALRAAGYLAAVTETQGERQSSDKLLELRRIRVRGSYSVNDLVRWLKYYEANGK